MPSAKKICGKDFIFQENNASFFSSNETKEGCLGKISTALEWLGLSLDLNLVENVWGIMVRRLNANVKKCNTVAQLLSSIMEVCKAIKNEIRHNLINSMSNRIYK